MYFIILYYFIYIYIYIYIYICIYIYIYIYILIIHLQSAQMADCGGRRIHRLHLCRGVRPPPDECPVFDAKQSDKEAPVLEF